MKSPEALPCCRNCTNTGCKHYSERDVWRGTSDRDGSMYSAASLTSETGCLLNPSTREYLNEKLIREAQCQSEIARNCGLQERYEGMQEIIALLRGNKK